MPPALMIPRGSVTPELIQSPLTAPETPSKQFQQNSRRHPSKRPVLRLRGENDLLAPSRVGSPHGPRSHDGAIIPKRWIAKISFNPRRSPLRLQPGVSKTVGGTRGCSVVSFYKTKRPH
jgi:hypothetical protein